ncbi:MATE family efflux transporter [Nocardioides sp. URHA0032]|uniref:MATE family efflux transporter n=1 Tax=Nocardioides sp. URHA0032 TaxID=1380388 RepID=UPI0009DED651|nr:polysaccharide biosynthesis C-terminal domain-containing protein [Nocardioides sp. URHA0032]
MTGGTSPPAPSPDPPVSSEARHLTRLARRGAASVVGAGFSAVFGVLLVVIVTNGFSPADAGTLFAATSTFLIVESVTLLGTDTGLVRWLPEQLASGRAADVRRTLAVAAVPVLALSLAVAVLMAVTASALAPVLVGTDSAATMTVMLRTLALVLPVAALHDLVVTATRGCGSMRPTVLVENVGRLGLQALAVLAVFATGGGPLALAAAWSAPYALGLVAGCWWLHRLVRRSTDRAGAAGDRVPTPWVPLAREFWAYTTPRAAARVTQTALKRSDIVMVAALASPTAAALYAAATRFIVLGQLFVQAVQQALSPHLSAVFAKGDKPAADALFQAATRWSVLAAWPFYLVLAGFSPTLMGVFGHGYHVASDVVVILSLTMLLATACGPVDSVLLMAGRSWLSLRNSTIALAVNVGLNLVLVPRLGIRGAAISWAVAIVVRNLLPLGQVRRQLGMWPGTRATMLVSASALVCFGAVDLVALALGPDHLAATLALLAASCAYLVSVWSWRERLGLDAFRTALGSRRRRGFPVSPKSAMRVGGPGA